jgi:hypothetical protein
MQEKNFTGLEDLKVWVNRYRDFLVSFLQRIQRSTSADDIGQQVLAILNLFPNVTDMTIN